MKSGSNIRLGAAVAVGAAAALCAWLLVHYLNSDSSKATVDTGATAVSESGLRTIANTLGRPIYWAGVRSGDTYELTQVPDGRIYVRYLPKGIKIGSRSPYLTIGTYPVTNAFATTRGVADRASSVRLDVGPNAIAFYDSSRPTNVYEAFKGSSYQVEVYSPSREEAQRVVASGKIASVGVAGGSVVPQSGATAATPAELEATSSTLGVPIYWAGEQSGVSYELTRTSDGRIYVRYLPSGVAVGSDHPYMTVATYPLKNAYRDTSNAAAKPDAVKVPVEGGVAFYSKAHPESVYVAFERADQQIEVYDPAGKKAVRLVRAGKIEPVP